MDIVKLLSKIHRAGIQIWVQDGALKYKAPEGTFSSELKEEVLTAKKEIIKYLEFQKQSENLKEEIKNIKRPEKLPLSYGQKWLWLTSQTGSQSAAFHIPAAFRIKGKLDISVLEKAINTIVNRHEVLRTIYSEEGGEVYQKILPQMHISMIAEEERVYREEEIMQELEKELLLPISLSKGPLFHTRILKSGINEYVLIMIFHHIICDNQSMNVFLAELMLLYDAYAEQKEPKLQELKLQYADYAIWQEAYLNQGVKQTQIEFWKSKLNDITQIPEIAGDFSRPDNISSKSIRIHYKINEETQKALKAVSQRFGCSLYVTLLSMFHILLYQYSGSKKIITGSPVVGRGQEELLPMIGLFFNTVVVRSQITKELSFAEYLSSVGKEAAESFANQDIPFELLADELGVQRQSNKTPVFQILFNMYTTRYKGELKEATLEVFNEELIGGQNMNSKFDITLLAIEYEDGIQIDFSFKADLYKEDTVKWLVKQFQTIMEICLKEPDIPIGKLPELKAMEYMPIPIQHDFIPFTKQETEQSIIERFDKMAQLYPDHNAVEMKEEKLSYKELKDISTILAKEILEKKSPYPRLSCNEKIRYGRQLILDGWGVEAQEKLKGLTVLAAGAGGSGSPVIMQLALLGVGTIIICDFDTVELSNLNRQALHDESRIGMNKAESAALTVQKMNPNVKTIVIKDKIDEANIFQIVGNAEAIFDNVDSIEAKFAISKCAVAKKIPHVISSMIERSSYAAIFHTPYTPCFHCCYDYEKLKTVQKFRQSSSGFSKVANSVASPSLFLSAGFAVNETLKILLGFENPAYNKYFFFNNQASENLAQTRGYQIVTYPFSKHFFDTCRKYGFDWEKGFSGRFIEEIPMEKDLHCIMCSGEEENQEEQNIRKAEYENPEIPEITALLMSHSINMVTGILGALRSGSAFVPLDAEYPKDRLMFLLEDTDAHCIICDKANRELAEEIRDLVNKNIVLINIEDAYAAYRKNQRVEEIEEHSSAESLAYILYTSGSMGKPKGVMQTHRNVLHYIMNYTNGLHIAMKDRLSLIPSFIFSAAMMDVFAALTNGATLCLYDFKKEGPVELGEWLVHNKISIYHSVPTVFRHLTASIKEGSSFPDLRVIDFGGEAVSVNDVELYHKYFDKNCILVNGLGATELNVIRQFTINQDSRLDGSMIPVGYPVEDTEIELLDEHGNRVGYNQPGEIVIHCNYLSPGYWALEEETKKSFRKDEDGNSIFYTGDLGRIRPDGCMEHLGRRDLQIKVRGIRVEPTEIEACLLKIQGIKEAVVTVKEGEQGSKHLVAYLNRSKPQDLEQIRAMLKGMLPNYMIPAYFIELDKMPLTATGKINRKALPEISAQLAQTEVNAEPENEIQKLLVSIWKTVLKIEKIGILDNFSDLGGDSIKAIRVNAELIRHGFSLKVQDIIEKQTIKELSESVVQKEQNQIVRDEKIAPLTATQRDYYRVYTHADKHIWNISTFFYHKNGFDEQILRRTVDTLVKAHDALRIVFHNENGVISQYCRSVEDANLYGYYHYDYRMEEEYESLLTKTADSIQKLHNLENGPLMQCAYFQTKDCDYFLISIHHFICDFLSANILIQDFTDIYMRNVRGENAEILYQSDSFMRWSLSMNHAAFTKEMEDRIPYWLGITQTKVRIPVDFPCEKRIIQDVQEVKRNLSKERTEKLFAMKIEKQQLSEEVIVLTVLGRAIKKWTGISRICVDFASNGRHEYGGLDIARTVGWFATSYPILIDCEEESFRDNLIRVKEAKNEMPGSSADFYILRDITIPEKYPEYDFHMPKEIYCNYFGVRQETQESVGEKSPFGISNIPVGRTISQQSDAGHKLCFSISIIQGCLCIGIQYSTKEYREESVEKLLQCYFEQLHDLT